MTSNSPWMRCAAVPRSGRLCLLQQGWCRPAHGRAGSGGCWLIFKVTSQEISWMAGARVSLQGAAKFKKHTGLHRCLTTLLILNMFFYPCWNLIPTWQYQETRLVLPEASYWAIGAFEDVGQSTKFPLRTVSILLLPNRKLFQTQSWEEKVSPPRDGALPGRHLTADTKEPQHFCWGWGGRWPQPPRHTAGTCF